MSSYRLEVRQSGSTSLLLPHAGNSCCSHYSVGFIPPAPWNPDYLVPDFVPRRIRRRTPNFLDQLGPESQPSSSTNDASHFTPHPSIDGIFDDQKHLAMARTQLWEAMCHAAWRSSDICLCMIQDFKEACRLFMSGPQIERYFDIVRDIMKITLEYARLMDRCLELGYNEHNTRRYWRKSDGGLTPFPQHASLDNNIIYWGSNIDYRRHQRQFAQRPTGFKIRIPGPLGFQKSLAAPTASSKSNPSTSSSLPVMNIPLSTDNTPLVPAISRGRKRKRDECEEDEKKADASTGKSVKGKGKEREEKKGENVDPDSPPRTSKGGSLRRSGRLQRRRS